MTYHLSVISYHLSVITYQLSLISYQLSAISYQLSVIGRRPWYLRCYQLVNKRCSAAKGGFPHELLHQDNR
ncbi:MAG: hypothetical protein F6J98_00260 [Moorea sp. SIO4G2]|nr:hypothetical protein [Moorena sp. SIO4G2]